MFESISILLLAVISSSRVQCQHPLPHPDPNFVPKASDTPLPYALSTTYLTYLAKTEQAVYKEIKQYTIDLQERLQLAQA